MLDPAKVLEYLISLPRETEFLEFKENNANREALGQHISAVSNSACLLGVEYGYVVFGVSDQAQEVVGTSFRPKSEKVGNEDLELWLQKMLDPAINFQIHEFEYGGKRVVLILVPACFDRPVRFMNQSFIRVGSNTRNLRDLPEKESEIWNKTRNRGFELQEASSGLTEQEVLELLDYPGYFKLTGQPLPPTPRHILDALVKEQFVKTVVGEGYAITNLGAILFANDLSKFPVLRRKAVRVIVYDGSNKTTTIKEREGKFGYAIGYENLVDYINDQLPTNEEIQRALRVERKMYPEIAIRELVANALIHQDLTVRGTGPTIEIYTDRIEISNPGKPLIEVDRFIDHKPQSRNENLAAFMRRIGFCEERGSGIDKVFDTVEVFQLPSPKFDENEQYLTVTLFSFRDVRDMSKEDRARACFQHACLKYVSNEVMTNASLRERFKLSDSKTDMVFVSNLISDAIKRGLVKPAGGDPAARKSAKYVPYWAI